MHGSKRERRHLGTRTWLLATEKRALDLVVEVVARMLVAVAPVLHAGGALLTWLCAHKGLSVGGEEVR